MMQWSQRMKSAARAGCALVALLFVAGGSFAQDAEEEEEAVWAAEVIAAIAATSGTIDTFSGSTDMKAERTWNEIDLVGVRFTGVYGTKRERNDGSRTSTETIKNAQELGARWKRTIRKRFFWLTPTEVSRDSVQELEVRYTLASGPGYRLWMQPGSASSSWPPLRGRPTHGSTPSALKPG